MSGITAQGGSFTFGTFSALVVGLSFQEATAEVTDMTGMNDRNGLSVMVPTGDQHGGGVTVDYLRTPTSLVPAVKTCGVATFRSLNYSVSRRVILQDVSEEVRAGELVRGTLRFLLTDYSGS